MEFKENNFQNQEKFPENPETKQAQPTEQTKKQEKEKSQSTVFENKPAEVNIDDEYSKKTKKQTEDSIEFRGHKITIPEENENK